MLRHRLVSGFLLAAGMGGVLVGDDYLGPPFPILFLCVSAVGVLSAVELVRLIPPPGRPRADLAVTAVLVVLWANWVSPAGRWEPVLFALAAVVALAFLAEMATYREPGGCTARVAHTILAAAYLGLLPTFFVRLRWLDHDAGLALAAAIFVPKFGDVGAYFTGRFLGRHRMTPLLSPKKTWEGFAGGMLAAVLTAVGVSFLSPVFRHGTGHAILFGLLVGLAGVLGDLAESLLKRDAMMKDAAQSIPGFGGILDVIDSVLFAAPAAYFLLAI